ncbi:leucine-rich repeat protein [Faecalibacterium duncaniae]
MKPKRLISLLVAVCMMITMLPLSAVTAFAADTSTVHEANDGEGIYRYAYKENEDGETVTITEFLGPVDPAKAPALYDITIPTTLGGCTVTGLGDYSFAANSDDGSTYDPLCSNIHSVTIPQKVTSIGKRAFYDCKNLTTLVLGEDIKTIGNYAFECCTSLTGVTIPQSVTSIGYSAFEGCTALNPLIINGPTLIGKHAFTGCTSLTSLTLCPDIQTIGDYAFDVTSLKTVTLPKNLTSIGEYAFACCSELESITIPEKVKTINPKTFADCSKLEYIILPAGLTTFDDSLENCRPECVIYYKDYKTAADALRDNNVVLQNDILAGHNFLYLCKVTFDANGGDLTGKGGNLTNYLTDNLTDHAEVPVYKTEKITDTKANDLKATDLDAINAPKRTGYKFTGWYTEDGKDGKLFDVDETAITEDITLYARWEFDPNAPGCHPLTVTGGTVTVKYDGSDVTSKLNSKTDAATGKKTYYVPDNAEVTVTLDKTAVPNGKVFDGWSTSLPTGQDYKAESITFRMSSGVNVSATYRDAATDHTPGTAACHPLTVTGGIVTVKNGDKDVTNTLTVTTDETTGKKTYYVPDGATVTVTLDKTLIPEGMVFDIWSTGKFSLPLGQDYKAESITFTMNTMSSDADIAAQYRDATIEDDGPNVLGTAAIIGTAAVGGAVLGYQAYSLGTEFAGKLMALPYFPSNRSALAMMLWEDAGKPMPESELLYPDVGQEEQDMDLQHAARWAMENELIPDLNDEGTAPEEMKFFPANPVSKLDVLNAWQKAQELKNN